MFFLRSEAGLFLETVDICPERVDAEDETAVGVETAVLRRFFWRSKKKKQKQEAADECQLI